VAHEGQTWVDGWVRVTYHAEWCQSRPFVTYVAGVAGAQFATLAQAWKHLTGKSLPEHFSDNDDAPTRQTTEDRK
jgi:hypothetical protein